MNKDILVFVHMNVKLLKFEFARFHNLSIFMNVCTFPEKKFLHFFIITSSFPSRTFTSALVKLSLVSKLIALSLLSYENEMNNKNCNHSKSSLRDEMSKKCSFFAK